MSGLELCLLNVCQMARSHDIPSFVFLNIEK